MGKDTNTSRQSDLPEINPYTLKTQSPDKKDNGKNLGISFHISLHIW